MQEPQYVVPRIDVIELPSPTPPQPNVNVTLGRIGLVGTFSWGPVGQPVRGYSEAALAAMFGGYKAGLTGWLSLHGIYLQNPQADVTVTRIAGATAAQASYTAEDATAKASMVVTAIYPGTKPISVTFAAGTQANTVKLSVVADGQTRTYDNLTLANCNTVSDPNVTVAEAVGAAALPAPVSNAALTGGDDGAGVVDTDYTGANGLGALAMVPVNIVVCAQQTDAIVQNALLAQAVTAVKYGLRFPVITFVRGQSASTIATSMASLSAIRGVATGPWATYDDLSGVVVAPDGVYAGILSLLNPWESPSNQQVMGLTSLDTTFSDDDVYTLTGARVSPITLDPLTGDFRIRNGVSTFLMPSDGSSDDWSQINVRREFDKIETEIYTGTQWAQSNTDPDLPTQLADWIDKLLLEHKTQTEEITDFQPTVGFRDPTNPKRVVTQISIQPDWAADFIDNQISQWNGS